MHLHVLLVDAEGRGHRVLHRLRILRRRPQDRPVPLDLGDGSRRLHRGVRSHRRVITRLDDLAALGELRVDVAVVAEDLAGLRDRCLQRLLVRLGRERRIRAVVPLDLQRPTALQHRPRVVANHRDAAERLEAVRRLERVERHRLLHAAHLLRGRVVDAPHGAAEHRRVLDRGVDHAFTEHVEPELRLAGDDVLLVVGGRVLAHELPGRAVLEADGFALRHRQLGCRRHQRAVVQRAAGRLVHDLVVPRDALAARDAPLPRGRRHQHRPRRGAGVPERLVEIADRPRAVGVLIAVARVANALLDGHAAPVGVELVGGHLRQRRPDAGAHLGAMGDDEDRAVGTDAEIHARIQRRRLGLGPERRLLREQGRGQDFRGEHEGAGSGDAVQELAAADVFDAAHDRPPFAAVLMAARIRW